MRWGSKPWERSCPLRISCPLSCVIAVKTSKFSPRRVNKHHSAGSAMHVLMCKDPTILFDTLLRFSSPVSCPLYPCIGIAPVAFWTLATDPEAPKFTRRSLWTTTTIWQHLATTFFPPLRFPYGPTSLLLLLYSKLMCNQCFSCTLFSLLMLTLIIINIKHHHRITNL